MMIIRKYTDHDINRIIEIWEGAVTATHHFLTPSDIKFYHYEIINNYIPLLEIYVAINPKDMIIGFIGFLKNQIEMLFIDPSHLRQKIGSALLDFAKKKKEELTLQVNEQNVSALQFYRSQHFIITHRSELDPYGKPFPILYMKYTPQYASYEN